MKTLYSILLTTISTFSVNCFALNTEQAPLSIDLWQQGKTLNFSAPARLDTTILTAKANNLAIEYPLATTLFDESK
ncbi:YjbG polysaccharide synthesis-related protein, partial [Vibrio parahaemolyticus]|nr:YjbG polysaccharide synthesis-related protein [Vibrio parahaemolyticus]